MLVSEWDVKKLFVCANVCMKDMKTFFRQEDMETCFLDKNLSFVGKKL